MITLTKEIPNVDKINSAYAKILCHHAAYGEYENIALFWVQTDDDGHVSAVISAVDNEMTVYNNGGDCEELSAFISAVSPKGIFTDRETADRLSLNIVTECTSLKKEPPHENEEKIENTYAGVEHLLDILSERLEIGSRDAAKADILHRVRHNCASFVTSDNSAGVIIYSGDIAVINGIAVKTDKAGLGLGRSTLNRLLECVRGRTVFVCARPHNVQFYTKNGFEIDEESAYCRL